MTYEEFQKLYNEDEEFKSLIDEKAKAKSKAIDNIATKQVENIIADINTSDNEFLQKPNQTPTQTPTQAQIPTQEPTQTPTQQVGQALEQSQGLTQDELNAIIGSDPLASAYINNSPKTKQKLEENTKNNSQIIDNRIDKNLSDDELFNQLPTNWDDEQKKEIVKYYKEYGKNYNNINDYANDTRNNFSKLYKQSEYLINDDNLYAHYELNDKHRVINSYINYLNDKTLKKENALDFNAFIFSKISRLESDLKSELQSYYAVLNASNIKNSWLNEYVRDYNKALKMNSSYDEIVFNIFIKAHFNEYELSKNAKNEIIATDKALGLSANVGDIESFNYYTLKAFVLNYLTSILGLIIGIILCVKYKDKALVYISPFVLLALGLVIDYFVIGIKLLKYV